MGTCPCASGPHPSGRPTAGPRTFGEPQPGAGTPPRTPTAPLTATRGRSATGAREASTRGAAVLAQRPGARPSPGLKGKASSTCLHGRPPSGDGRGRHRHDMHDRQEVACCGGAWEPTPVLRPPAIFRRPCFLSAGRPRRGGARRVPPAPPPPRTGSASGGSASRGSLPSIGHCAPPLLGGRYPEAGRRARGARARARWFSLGLSIRSCDARPRRGLFVA